jgi:hypothetical protein
MSGQKRQFTAFNPKADVGKGFAAFGITLGDILKFDHAGVGPVGVPWKARLSSWYLLEREKPKWQGPWEGSLRPLQWDNTSHPIAHEISPKAGVPDRGLWIEQHPWPVPQLSSGPALHLCFCS